VDRAGLTILAAHQAKAPSGKRCQGLSAGAVVHDQDLDLAQPLRQLAKESGQRAGETLGFVETRDQGQTWPGGYAGIRAGWP
jgi:hypothetical protein